MYIVMLIYTSLILWGLLSILLLLLFMLAFSRSHRLSRDRAAILVIGLILLSALVAVSVDGR